MISKGEAIQRLKKMGVMVADDQSIVTVLLPAETPLEKGVKDIKEKLKAMEYEASFSIHQSRDAQMEKEEIALDANESLDEETFDEEDVIENVSEEELKGSLLSMDDDGQFTLGGFGMDF